MAKTAILAGAALAALSAAADATGLWHYAQMDFELYRLEAMRDEVRRAGLGVGHPGRVPDFSGGGGRRFRIRCDETNRPPFQSSHVSSASWKDGFLTVSVYGGWRDVPALRSPALGWEAQVFDGSWRPTATYSGGDTPPHRDDLPEDRTFDGLAKSGGFYDAGAETFWEGFDADAKGDAQYAFYGRRWGKSLCHAWSAWPAFLFVSEAMGVKPTADGWTTYETKPIPGAEGMKASVPTPRGTLEFSVPGAKEN